MKISLKSFIGFTLAAVLCLGLWYKFGFPRIIFMDMAVGKTEAVLKAQDYLVKLGVDLKDYKKAVVFQDDEWADRYLQKTLGLAKEEEYLKNQEFEIFYWRIRFFKEYQKEEYVVKISSVSGKVLSFEHSIDDIESRSDIHKDNARQKGEKFLKNIAGFSPDLYDFHKEEVKKYDFRTDYIFSWEKKDSFVAWNKNQGQAKILLGATVSGDEVREFYLSRLDIPEKFKRYLERQLMLGQYLASLSYLITILFIVIATVITLKRKSGLTIKLNNKLYFYLAGIIAVLNIVDVVNGLEKIIIYYPTSVNLASYIWLAIIRTIISVIFLAAAFIFPGLAGESLRAESLPEAKYSSFLYFIKSSFYSRGVAKSIIFGYLIFFIMLGGQAVMFYFGQKYLGVWREWMRFTQYSSAYIPFLAAFVVGVTASLNEEIMFRLFGISWGVKYLKNVTLAVVVAALVWGFGHSAYAIFPVWFRAIEVSIIGIFLGVIFIRYGLIPLLVAHYLFDVFWGVTTYIFGKSPQDLFLGSCFVLLLPLFFAGIIYFINKPDNQREITTFLDVHQRYNLEILNNFVSLKKSQGLDAEKIRSELLKHNWDIDLVDLSIEGVFKKHA